jgi:group I intron endonuclease
MSVWKTHTNFALSQIRKVGNSNPMFGIKHSIETKLKMSLAKSKFTLGLFDIETNLINTFINQVEISKYLNISKSTVGRHLKSGKILLNKYFIRKIN